VHFNEYCSYTFELRDAEEKPDISGKFNYRSTDVDRPFMAGSEDHNSLELEVAAADEIFTISASHVDGIGAMQSVPGTYMKITKELVVKQ
jgi:hypothetical protein